ncbi:hypothetical protein P4O66_008832 [Electrophorus voltai]|uniref:C-C motif chemokine n=1 Tax=Electrophorus voltai TaxID=2609070 RepID=A0AAD9DY75_9TELE|nr:hypothetical protein P4O66_008832 [Electrophorus voltai]
MKTYCTAVITLLLFAFCSQTLTQQSHKPDKCCFKHIESRIPEAFVKRFEETSPECNNPGVILYTTQQKEICANPDEKWVQRLMRIVQNHRKDSTFLIVSEDVVTH